VQATIRRDEVEAEAGEEEVGGGGGARGEEEGSGEEVRHLLRSVMC
jgi:hypothetical protein